ncbi:MAG: YciI family protein [Acidimicrobiales bacterium]
MRYLLLIYSDPKAYADLSEEDGKRLMDDYWAFTDEIAKSGEMQGGEALQGTETATTVQRKAGDTLTTDGPFAETKEVLGGYYLVDVPDLERAIEIAAKIPDAAVGNGRVEVRPVMEFSRDEGDGGS